MEAALAVIVETAVAEDGRRAAAKAILEGHELAIDDDRP